MVVRPIDHPWADERVRTGKLLLHPGADLRRGRQRPRDLDGLPGIPVLTVDEPDERVLELVVCERVRFAKQQGKLGRQRGAPFDKRVDGVHQVVHVQEGLPMRGAAGVEPACVLPLIDALDLVRQRDRVTAVVVDAGDPEHHDRDIASFFAHDLLGAYLRGGVCPGGLDRPVLVDEQTRLRRSMDQHCAREDELLDLEGELVQSAQHAPRALDRDLVVLGARFAEEVVVGREVDDGDNALPMVLADRLEPRPHALVRGDLDRHVCAAGGRRRRCLAVEADDHAEPAGEPAHHRLADAAVRARDDDDAAVLCHDFASSMYVVGSTRSFLAPDDRAPTWAMVVVIVSGASVIRSIRAGPVLPNGPPPATRM